VRTSLVNRAQSHLQMRPPRLSLVCVCVRACARPDGTETWKRRGSTGYPDAGEDRAGREGGRGGVGGSEVLPGVRRGSRTPVPPSQFVTDEAIGNKQRGDSNCLSFSAVVHWVLSSGLDPPRVLSRSQDAAVAKGTGRTESTKARGPGRRKNIRRSKTIPLTELSLSLSLSLSLFLSRCLFLPFLYLLFPYLPRILSRLDTNPFLLFFAKYRKDFSRINVIPSTMARGVMPVGSFTGSRNRLFHKYK